MAKKLVGDDAVAELAPRQHGLVSRDQAIAAGYSSSAIDRRLASGAWELVHSRVYRLRGTPKSHHQKTLAVCMHAGDGAFASHRTAAWLWQLDGFRDEAPRKVHVCGPHVLRLKLKDVELFRRREVVEEGHTLKEAIPTTVLTRTLCDLAGIVGEETLEIALDSAGRGSPEFIHELAEFLAGISGRGRKGFGVLVELVRKRRGTDATGSPFETKVLRAIRGAKLPAPINQYPVFVKGDRPFAHLDFAWPEQKVALLPDGVGVHKSKRQFEKDAVQRATLTSLGWRWLSLTPDLLNEGTWLRVLAKLLKEPAR